MEWIINNWSLIIVVLAVIVYFIMSGKKSVMKWLLFAVTMAEQEMGGGTGKLKLAQVYQDFVATYPLFSKIVPFAVFSAWVDAVLDEMRHLLETNSEIKKFVEGE
jgi:hypothetical protein